MYDLTSHRHDALTALHSQALVGDRGAMNAIFESLEPLLRRRLAAQFPRVPADWIHDAVQDTLLEYRVRPDHFDTRRGVSLESFLFRASRCDLLNHLDAERRRGRLQRDADRALGLSGIVMPCFDRQLDVACILQRIRIEMSDIELQVLDELAKGDVRPQILAGVVGASHLPPVEQRIAVKRVVNRILQRLRRLGLRSI